MHTQQWQRKQWYFTYVQKSCHALWQRALSVVLLNVCAPSWSWEKATPYSLCTETAFSSGLGRTNISGLLYFVNRHRFNVLFMSWAAVMLRMPAHSCKWTKIRLKGAKRGLPRLLLQFVWKSERGVVSHLETGEFRCDQINGKQCKSKRRFPQQNKLNLSRLC